jgi:hypothetical protein
MSHDQPARKAPATVVACLSANFSDPVRPAARGLHHKA